jgi:hypothetical protein
LKSGAIPEMSWTREVVGQLMKAVAAVVDPTCDSKPGVAVKVTMMLGKPVPKGQATSLAETMPDLKKARLL